MSSDSTSLISLDDFRSESTSSSDEIGYDFNDLSIDSTSTKSDTEIDPSNIDDSDFDSEYIHEQYKTDISPFCSTSKNNNSYQKGEKNSKKNGYEKRRSRKAYKWKRKSSQKFKNFTEKETRLSHFHQKHKKKSIEKKQDRELKEDIKKTISPVYDEPKFFPKPSFESYLNSDDTDYDMYISIYESNFTEGPYIDGKGQTFWLL